MLVSYQTKKETREKNWFSRVIAKKYTTDHEWISVENGVGKLGITRFAADALGDVVFVETNPIGDVVEIQSKTRRYGYR
jgi:glycine cleavage system H protein